MKILFVGAHPDDETSAAGTLFKMQEKGAEIFILVLSPCVISSIQVGILPMALEKEFNQSMAILKISESHIFKAGFESRKFSYYRQEILDEIISVGKKVNPSVIITMHSTDTHQDHCVVSKECTRAFPYKTILGTEIPKNPICSKHKCFVHLEKRHVKRKIECVRCYKSQLKRVNNSEKEATAALILRGSQSGGGFAEAFEVISLHL
jgi:N-acetylglucosamine malate deacetylase 1